MLDCEIVVVASSTLAGSFLASAGLIVCNALRMVIAASCELTSIRRAPRAWSTWSWARTTKSKIAAFTGGVSMAAETASATTGRAADTKFDVRARRSVAWSAM